MLSRNKLVVLSLTLCSKLMAWCSLHDIQCLPH